MPPEGIIAVVAALVIFAIVIAKVNKSAFEGSVQVTKSSIDSYSDEHRHFFLQVHGIYHHNRDGSDRQHVIRSCHVGELLKLVAEPDNPYDENAVKVCRENGDQLGYLDSVNAMRFTHDMSIGWTYRVTADEIFAADRRGKYGCRIRVGVLTMSGGLTPQEKAENPKRRPRRKGESK